MNLEERLAQVDDLHGLIPHEDGWYLAGLAQHAPHTIRS